MRPPALTREVLAPAANNFVTASPCPFTHAQCSAVLPWALAMLGSCGGREQGGVEPCLSVTCHLGGKTMCRPCFISTHTRSISQVVVCVCACVRAVAAITHRVLLQQHIHNL